MRARSWIRTPWGVACRCMSGGWLGESDKGVCVYVRGGGAERENRRWWNGVWRGGVTSGRQDVGG